MNTELSDTFVVAHRWADLVSLPTAHHDPEALAIFEKHGLGATKKPVPITGRYTKGRRWKPAEFEACFKAWENGTPLTLIAASLNRNPQDMIYKLLDRCKDEGLKFTQRGASAGSSQWTEAIAACARELFQFGVPAWKIATAFQTDFEHVEKALFGAREGYGHKKMNPFAICSDHKVWLNGVIIEQYRNSVTKVLDAFAGEGKFTRSVLDNASAKSITMVEIDDKTFLELEKNSWPTHVTRLNADNLSVIEKMIKDNLKFDIIDLDPFITCNEQASIVWSLLEESSLVFLTFGGEYRRSFIGSNRKAMSTRYDYSDFESSNTDYLEAIPYAFAGWVAGKAAEFGFKLTPIRSVRYPNICRFYFEAQKIGIGSAKVWLEENTKKTKFGRIFPLSMPRFREIRKEFDNLINKK